mmetsp:Transcript_6007/g.15215  ORF Transcript_6007/g.15215 Transcript_6007/m.15215 type:complete len:535 (+) Transcript_6007:119-1723(+)
MRTAGLVLAVLMCAAASIGRLAVAYPQRAQQPVSLANKSPEQLRTSILSSYFSNDQMEMYLKDYVERCSHISRLFSIGKSASGVRELWVLEISNRPGEDEAKPYMKFVANMHGDEPSGRQVLVQWAEWMCSDYGTDPEVTDMVERFHVMLLPSMNPDGFDAQQRVNHDKKDLNRDFPDPIHKMNFRGWARDLPPSGKECAETLAVMSWTTAHRFVASVSMHEGAVVANYPWDGSLDRKTHYSACPDDLAFKHLAHVYASNNPGMRNSKHFRFGITNGAQWYPLWGGMQDWNYLHAGCLDLTLELSDNKWPAPGRLPSIWKDNKRALLAYAMAAAFGGAYGFVAGLPPSGAGGASKPLAATISVQGIDRDSTSGPHGDFYRPLGPGTYTITASVDGYQIQSKQVSVLPGNQGAQLEFILQPLQVAMLQAEGRQEQPELKQADAQLPVQMPLPVAESLDADAAQRYQAPSHKDFTAEDSAMAAAFQPPTIPRRRIAGLMQSTYLVYLIVVIMLSILLCGNCRRRPRRRTGSFLLQA